MRLDLAATGAWGASPSQASGPMQRLDARIKIVVVLGLVLVAVLTPPTAPMVLIGLALVLSFFAGLSGLDPVIVLRRWLSLLVVVLVFALAAAQGHPDRATLGYAGVLLALVAKNGLAVLSLVLLSQTTAWLDLLSALRRLRAPRVLVAILEVMARHLTLLGEELTRMLQAREARRFGRTGLGQIPGLASMMGLLMLRSVERGERVYAAMLARGWDGQFRTLGDDTPDPAQPKPTGLDEFMSVDP